MKQSKKVSEYSVTEKPWGKEILVAHTDKYALKEILMLKGTRSSLQSHDFKKETMYVLAGKIELETCENDQIHKEIYLAGESYTIEPKTIHRVSVVQDCRLIEVSTPELDDVIRYQDDYNRT